MGFLVYLSHKILTGRSNAKVTWDLRVVPPGPVEFGGPYGSVARGQWPVCFYRPYGVRESLCGAVEIPYGINRHVVA